MNFKPDAAQYLLGQYQSAMARRDGDDMRTISGAAVLLLLQREANRELAAQKETPTREGQG